jgi:ion channel POLLUX/CASTOR
MSATTLRERFRYRLDNFLAGGSGALFLSLVVAFTCAIGGVLALRLVLAMVIEDDDTSPRRQAWIGFLQLTDPGNMAQDNETGTVYKVAAVVAGFTGVVIFSSLIAFLTTALNDAIGHLRKGHSRVVENDHTLVLGWGERVVEILNELAIANESEKDAAVVVLSGTDKEEMDEHLRLNFTKRRTTRVVTRHGSTASLAPLRHVNAERARAAIVLATCDAAGSTDDKLASDAHVIKTVLALTSYMGEGTTMSVVAEVFEPKNRQVVEDIAPGRVVVVDAEEMLAKIMVQTSRTSGLAVVYSELLSFDGCEIYFHKAAWNGVSFGELQFRFKDGVPIGLRRADGSVAVRPPPETVLGAEDEIIIVAQDDSSIAFLPRVVVTPQELVPTARRIERRKERLAVIGWSPKAPTVVREYAGYVLEGSSIDVVLHEPTDELLAELESARLAVAPTVELRILSLDPLDRDALAAIQPFSYDTVLVLRRNSASGHNAERVDAESLMVLLHLRRLRRDVPGGTWVPTKIITEVLDSANQDLIARAGVDDFIISERLVSMVFAQLSQEPRMKLVYDDLFEEDGSEIYVKPAWLYFEQLPVQVRFGDLMRVAQKRDGEVCIGFKLQALQQDATKNFGVSLVPPKDELVTLSPHDSLVVVAEDDR